MLSPDSILTFIIFLPALFALGLLAFDGQAKEGMRYFTLLGTALTLALTVQLYMGFKVADSDALFRQSDSNKDGKLTKVEAEQALNDSNPVGEIFQIGVGDKPEGSLTRQEFKTAFETFQTSVAARTMPGFGGMQSSCKVEWIKHWNVYYSLGVDGISLPLVMLTGLVFVLSALASWSVDKHVKGYLMLFLILETGVLGVFLSLDFFLFYVFWEVMLLPMYFLIGIWGGPRREYAAIKFFLYTLAGGVLMLIAMLMFYFNSGRSFDLLYLAEVAAGRGSVPAYSESMQIAAFILLFIGFAIKLPSFPFHTWLPDAHVEAPTPISMILAGILLKLGGYGIIRIAFPLCPYGVQYAAYFLVALGVFSIIYGAFAAMAQTDFKRLVAYSSVSHMGYVLVGLAVWKIVDDKTFNADYWRMGINAAMFQMIAHGISSTGMFFMVGVLYDRVHHRDLNKFGGIAQLMPHYTGLAAVIFFAGLGLPGLCGFVGEIFSVLSCWNYDPLLAIISAAGVILTAGYILWTMQRVYLGPEYKGPHPEAITPINARELTVAYTLVVCAIVLGVFPGLLFNLMDGSIGSLVNSMAATYDTMHGAGAAVQTTLVR